LMTLYWQYGEAAEYPKMYILPVSGSILGWAVNACLSFPS
jgi:hypothetical protein